MRILPLLMILAAVPAIAAEPGQETPVAPAPAAAPASAPAPAAVPAPAAAPAAAAAVTPPDAVAAPAAAEEFKVPKGYKKKTRAGQPVYCRNEVPVGTRFPTEYCFSQADLERIEKNKKSIQQDVQMRTKMCTTGSSCGG